MGVVVHIDKFSGPMALLLHLIRREEMDIFDININAITKQYLESIRAMKKLNLEMAGDFIAMAATLIQIKSNMLLPQYNEEGQVIEQADPRKDLVRRLLEYQAYQEAGHNLYKRQLVGREVWLRGSREEIRVDDDQIVIEEENALFALISSYRSAMKNMKKAVHKVAQSLQSIADRILQMRPKLMPGTNTQLSELLTIESGYTDKKGQLLITFLSLLELAKIGLIQLFQSENFADIHVETKGVIDSGSISNIENYESQVHAQSMALDLPMTEADRQFDLDTAEAAVGQNAESAQMSFSTPASTEEGFEVQAATDEDIENEEKLYGETQG